MTKSRKIENVCRKEKLQVLVNIGVKRNQTEINLKDVPRLMNNSDAWTEIDR